MVVSLIMKFGKVIKFWSSTLRLSVEICRKLFFVVPEVRIAGGTVGIWNALLDCRDSQLNAQYWQTVCSLPIWVKIIIKVQFTRIAKISTRFENWKVSWWYFERVSWEIAINIFDLWDFHIIKENSALRDNQGNASHKFWEIVCGWQAFKDIKFVLQSTDKIIIPKNRPRISCDNNGSIFNLKNQQNPAHLVSVASSKLKCSCFIQRIEQRAA